MYIARMIAYQPIPKMMIVGGLSKHERPKKLLSVLAADVVRLEKSSLTVEAEDRKNFAIPTILLLINMPVSQLSTLSSEWFVKCFKASANISQ
jgi:hypothetical protein